jgi:hypothetical protein
MSTNFGDRARRGFAIPAGKACASIVACALA